jgi:DNA replication protein DnaC
MVLGESHGGDARVKGARFPQVKTLEDFDFSFQLSLRRQTMAHLAHLDFLREATNVIFLRPPGRWSFAPREWRGGPNQSQKP